MSTNQSQKPLTTTVNSLGHIEIGGCDTVELAKKYGTPLYVLDKATVESACNEYKTAFGRYAKIRPMYASKALCTIATAQLIAKMGFGFDVVSGGELYTVYKAGVNMSEVIFNGNNKSYDELSLAVELNTGRISVDNFSELEMLNKIAVAQNKQVKIHLRIAPGIECHTHEYIQTGRIDSKFGFDLSQIDRAITYILGKYRNLELVGLHTHVGSQIFDNKIYVDEIEILYKEMARIREKFVLCLGEINIGGGLGVKYTEADNPPSIKEFADTIMTALVNASEKYNIRLPFVYIEPGRSIVSPAGVTLYTIGSQKQIPEGKKYIAIDGGMADNPRPAMYEAEYFAEIANKSASIENLQTVTIAGKFCESGDILIKNIKLPNPEKGDILCVFNTGAYNFSMASNYNRVQKPAMVLVNNSQSDIIVYRETLDDLISRDVILDGLE